MSSKRKREDGDLDLYSGKELMASVTTMLCIPATLVFRNVMNQGQLSPLLSRSEAHTFLQINGLSQELDVLTDLTQQILQDEELTRLKVLKDNDVLYLRPLQVLLESKNTSQQLNKLALQVKRTVKELLNCCTVLQHSAEQNWSVAQLLHPAAIGKEKQTLSEIEDEVCRRIQLLTNGPMLSMTSEDPAPSMLSMEKFCETALDATLQNHDSTITPNGAQSPASLIGHTKDIVTSPTPTIDRDDARARNTTPLLTGTQSLPANLNTPVKNFFSTRKMPVTQQKDAPERFETPDTKSPETKATCDKKLIGTVSPKPQANGNEPSAKTASMEIAATIVNTEASISQHRQSLSLQEDCSDDDEILECMVQQGSARKLQLDSEPISVSPKPVKTEKENEPSQSSTRSSPSSSVHEDAAFRSQNAAEVLSSIRRLS